MTDRDNVVFVEVRQRTSNRFGTSVETVNRQKVSVCRKWQHYLQLIHWDDSAPCRFDVTAIKGDRANACADWIKDAFKGLRERDGS